MGPLLPCNLYVGIVGTHTACISYYERTRRIQGCIPPPFPVTLPSVILSVAET